MMMNIKQVGKSLLLGSILSGIVACSHQPPLQEFPETADSAEEVKKLDADIRTALKNQVNVLSPRSFKRAQEALVQAKGDQEKFKASKVILHRIAEGRAYLRRSQDFAQVSQTNMEDVVVARQQAITAGAVQYMPSDFSNADENLRLVTSDVEDNDLTGMEKNRGRLQSAYLDLELEAIKSNYLKRTQETIQLALKEGAREFAPRSLALAEKKAKDTDAFINANRHDTPKLKARADEARADADHVLKITRDAKANRKVSPEELALRMETETNKADDSQNELKEERGTAKILAAQRSSLESVQEFSQRFEEARTKFTEKEAEVYKQGDKLLIRLKGLEFPVSQAVLRGNNFPLLAKVQKVIVGFGRSSIVVEGHTDSDGDKMSNDQLSADRAQAVSQYLQSNSEPNQLNITAIGYGYQKPLASNKTPVGKAQNRRVDIVITPEHL